MFECFDNPPDRKATNCFKWDRNFEKFGRADVIPLWIADMDFAVPEVVTQALQARLNHPVYGYSYRSDEYIAAIQSWLASHYRWKVEKQHLLFYPPGTVAAINCLVNLFSEVGDEVIVQTPSYPPLMNIVKQNKRKLVENELVNIENEYQIDFEHLASCFTQKTKIMLLCSPHNPSGRVWQRTELEKIAKLCREHSVLLISDEVHADLVFAERQHLHFNRIEEEKRPESITIISACKTFNIAALPQSTLICSHPAIRHKVQHSINTSQLNLDGVFSAVATQAAYQKGDEWLMLLLQYIRINREIVAQVIQEKMPEVKLVNAQGTYLAWLDFRQLSLSHAISHETLFEKMIHEAGVGIYDGLLFGAAGRGYFRINLACSSKLLKHALAKIVMLVSTIKEIPPE